jgi:hypothetical protein
MEISKSTDPRGNAGSLTIQQHPDHASILELQTHRIKVVSSQSMNETSGMKVLAAVLVV